MAYKGIPYRAHNGYDQAQASDESGVGNFGPSMTIQSMAEEADINTLMDRYGITGKMPEITRTPTFDDYTNIFDFRSAVEAIRNAQQDFMSYPANIRGRFENNPQLFLEYCSDPNNLDEMRKLGLAKPQETPTTTTGPGTPPGPQPLVSGVPGGNTGVVPPPAK